MIKEFSDKERLTDVHYNNLIKKENAFAEAGLKTREGAENKIAEITEEHATKRLELSDQYLASIKELMKNSGNMTESQREQLKGELDHRVRLIAELQEELKWKKELAAIKSAGVEAKFVKEVDENRVTLAKEAAIRRQKVMGPTQSPLDRARGEGELLAEGRFAQQLEELERRVRIAREGSDAAAIASAENRRDRLIQIIDEEKKKQGEFFVELAEYQQSAEYGWKAFWEKYQEDATTAARVVEQSMTSVTKNLEDAFANMFETGTFDAKKMLKAISADVGKLVAKMAVSDLGNILFKKGKPSGEILGNITGAASKGGEGTSIIDQGVSALKRLWGAVTGTSSATEDATVKTVEGVAKTVLKTSTETTATSALTSLTAAAQSAATALSMIGTTSGGGSGAGGLGSVLGNIFSGGKSAVSGSGAEWAAAAEFGPVFGTWAKGGAFNNGVQAFAKGGTFTNKVVHQPTMFRFADGVGLMGEAGAEAIMPLGRDSQGRLGVRFQGKEAPQQRSNNTVNTNNINVSINSKNGDPAEIRRSGSAVARQIASAVASSGRYR